MQGKELDDIALRQRIERKLRADCIQFGLPSERVARWSLDRLLIERRRAARWLMEHPGGLRWDG